MSTEPAARRRSAEHNAAAVLAILNNENPSGNIPIWRNVFTDVHGMLADHETSDSAALLAVRDRLQRFLSSGGRAVSDFYIHRDAFEDRRAVNDEFFGQLDALKATLNDEGEQ